MLLNTCSSFELLKWTDNIPVTTEFSSKLAKPKKKKKSYQILNFAIIMCDTFFNHKSTVYSKLAGKACPLRFSCTYLFLINYGVSSAFGEKKKGFKTLSLKHTVKSIYTGLL